MKEEIQKILYTELTIEESERLTEKLLNLFSVTKRFSKIEMENILRKVKTVVIKENFKQILMYHFGKNEYTSKEDEDFFKRYAGKQVNVYEWAGDWWICEDDNYVITTDCFTKIS